MAARYRLDNVERLIYFGHALGLFCGCRILLLTSWGGIPQNPDPQCMTPTNMCTSVYLGQNWSNIRSSWSNSALASLLLIVWAEFSVNLGYQQQWFNVDETPDILILVCWSNDARPTTSIAILSWHSLRLSSLKTSDDIVTCSRTISWHSGISQLQWQSRV